MTNDDGSAGRVDDQSRAAQTPTARIPTSQIPPGQIPTAPSALTGRLEIRPAVQVPWEDVARVFEGRGDPSRCWCQYFAMPRSEWRASTPAGCRSRLQEQLAGSASGRGLVASLDGEPVGWCAVEPRAHLPRLLASRIVTASPRPPARTPADDAEPTEDGVWALTCFVVRSGHRRMGIATELARAAVEWARAQGATVLEGYPAETERRRTSSADLFVGTVAQFTAAGFVEVARPTPARVIMQHALG
ncbi:GNAT family N-acetyltransferase [Plantibacter sp. YIM 135249]|uniref:GNAT family N-acetyltransferase n=1 Tax=Plantibacter sp. YIM 135249 TaxID=3423918 RepID=UPI003D33DA37